jgi:hypothetical protein
MMVLAGLVTVGLLAGAIGLWRSLDTEVPTAAVAVPPKVEASGVFTADELIMMDLANRGYIPKQAVDWRTIELKKLVAKGLVPEQALRSTKAPVGALFSTEELVTIDLAKKGLIPMQTVDWDVVELKRLANLGLIPRQAVPEQPSR